MNYIDERLAAVSKSQVVSRVGLTLCLFLSVLIFISQFNAYFSWYRKFAFQDFGKMATPKKVTQQEEKEADYFRKQVAEQWLGSRSFKIPLIDMPILPMDIGTLGGTSLCLSTGFFMFVSRREHFSICYLLRDVDKCEDYEFKETVLYSVISGLVSVSLSADKSPCINLAHLPRVPQSSKAVSQLFRVLIYVPVLALSASVLGDLLGFCVFKSPFRGTVPLSQGLTFEFIFHVGVAVLATLITAYFCFATSKFQFATSRIVDEFGNKLREHEAA